MNRSFTLIAAVSGIVAGAFSIYVVPPEIEIGLWLLLVIVLGALAQRYLKEKLFLRSFLYGIIAGIFITIMHILLIADYLTSHVQEALAMEELGIGSDRLTLLAFAPVYWIMLGLLTGLAAITWQKFRND
jgi:lysylphosphatidylglycerol synthetase-like protein (DUF2156 family)